MLTQKSGRLWFAGSIQGAVEPGNNGRRLPIRPEVDEYRCAATRFPVLLPKTDNVRKHGASTPEKYWTDERQRAALPPR